MDTLESSETRPNETEDMQGDVNTYEVADNISRDEDIMASNEQPALQTTAEAAIELGSGSGDCTILYIKDAVPSTSKSLQPTVGKNKIKEYVRILRPTLPRTAKARAYTMLQNIAKGSKGARSSLQPKLLNRSRRRPQKTSRTKTSHSSIRGRGQELSVHSSSHSRHCGCSCGRITRATSRTEPKSVFSCSRRGRNSSEFSMTPQSHCGSSEHSLSPSYYYCGCCKVTRYIIP